MEVSLNTMKEKYENLDRDQKIGLAIGVAAIVPVGMSVAKLHAAGVLGQVVATSVAVGGAMFVGHKLANISSTSAEELIARNEANKEG